MYQSLYRKYRPSDFDNVYGQDVAKKILINSLKKDKISHAYLFFGPRGTGKTSIAKLFARICNCENSQKGCCCEKCSNCIESSQKNCVDIIEIDAASNNGVDEIRELKNKINLVPNKLKYKVYIIDEVHMLSIGAFNALLKTLEEPPEHIIFILATTEYYKVPSTIISRCQTIEFKNIDDNSMFKRLKTVSEMENIKIDDCAINEIVTNSKGGLRDALGILDKASLFSDNAEISKNDIEKILGVVPDEQVDIFIKNIINKNEHELLSLLDQYISEGKNIFKLLSDVINKLIVQDIVNNENVDLNIVKIIYKYYNDLKKNTNHQLLVGLMIYEICHTNVRENISREIIIEKKDLKTENNKKDNSIDINFINIRINNSFSNANKSNLSDIKSKWNNLKKYTFDNDIGSYVCDLLDCIPVVVSDTNILLSTEYDSVANKINKSIKKYEQIINEKIGVEKKIIVISNQMWQLEKNKYLDKIKNGYKYEHINEIEIGTDNECCFISDDSLEKKAHKLFGEILD